MNDFKNPDGTYNGVKFFSAFTGLSEAEIKWMADRMKQLIVVEKKTKEEAKAIVKKEGKGKPWEIAT